jgi:hypothetical protein
MSIFRGSHDEGRPSSGHGCVLKIRLKVVRQLNVPFAIPPMGDWVKNPEALSLRALQGMRTRTTVSM